MGLATCCKYPSHRTFRQEISSKHNYEKPKKMRIKSLGDMFSRTHTHHNSVKLACANASLHTVTCGDQYHLQIHQTKFTVYHNYVHAQHKRTYDVYNTHTVNTVNSHKSTTTLSVKPCNLCINKYLVDSFGNSLIHIRLDNERWQINENSLQ